MRTNPAVERKENAKIVQKSVESVRYLHNGHTFLASFQVLEEERLLYFWRCQIWIIAKHFEMFEFRSAYCVYTLDIKKMLNFHRVGERG